MDIKIGTYVGDGIAGRAITGVGFTPEFVIIKSSIANSAVCRATAWAGDQSKDLGNNLAPAANHIQSLDADGFTLGSGDQVNRAATTFFYLALAGTNINVIAYTGNATDNRTISGAGFTPNLGMVFEINPGASNQLPRFRTSDMPADPAASSVGFGAVIGAQADRLQALTADGIQVSADDSVNENLVPYSAVVLAEEAGVFEVFTYTGNGADNRDLSSLVSFVPDFIITKAYTTTQVGVMRFKDEVGDLSLPTTAVAETANLIQMFISGGMQVGTDSRVNQNTIVYYGFAFKDNAAPAGSPALVRVANAATVPGAAWGAGITEVLPAPSVTVPSTGQTLTIVRG